MINEDEEGENSQLVGAITNGLERGETPEEVMKSLLNAGYKQKEVNKAFEEMPKDTTPKINLSEQTKQEISETPEKSSKIKIILIIVALLLILGVLGFVFRDFVIGFIKK